MKPDEQGKVRARIKWKLEKFDNDADGNPIGAPVEVLEGEYEAALPTETVKEIFNHGTD